MKYRLKIYIKIKIEQVNSPSTVSKIVPWGLKIGNYLSNRGAILLFKQKMREEKSCQVLVPKDQSNRREEQ